MERIPEEKLSVEYRRSGYNAIGYERWENGVRHFKRFTIDDFDGFDDEVRVMLGGGSDSPSTLAPPGDFIEFMFPRDEFLAWLRMITLRDDTFAMGEARYDPGKMAYVTTKELPDWNFNLDTLRAMIHEEILTAMHYRPDEVSAVLKLRADIIRLGRLINTLEGSILDGSGVQWKLRDLLCALGATYFTLLGSTPEVGAPENQDEWGDMDREMKR